MHEPSPRLKALIEAAEQAGEILLDFFCRPREGLNVFDKSKGDLVSDADKASEKALAESLGESFPNAAHLREESGRLEGRSAHQVLIYDPLDGTKNFLHQGLNWAVSVALEEKGHITAAVTYAPRLNELFCAEEDQGAWLRDTFRNSAGRWIRLQVYPQKNLEGGIIETYPQQAFLGDAAGFYTASGTEVRTIGSTCLDLAYVAAGRYQALAKKAGFGPWDLAAGALLVREAGGVITDIEGNRDFIYGKSVVAANPALHDKITRKIRAGAHNVFSP